MTIAFLLSFHLNQKYNTNFRGTKCDFGTDFITNRTIINEQFLTSFHKILHITRKRGRLDAYCI